MGAPPPRRTAILLVAAIALHHSLDLLDGAAESWRNRTPFGKGPSSWIWGKLFLQGEYE
jgi:hypothetical protein